MRRGSLVLLLALFSLLNFSSAFELYAGCPTASLTVTITSSPFALFDSNNQQSPRVATLSARVQNAGSSSAQNVAVFIGNGTTPGAFTASGTRSLEMLGLPSEARRYLGTLPAGATQVLFWQVLYPVVENTSYSYTVWATTEGGCGDSQIAALHVRSATANNANHIRPPNGSVTVEPGRTIVPGEMVTITITGFDLGAVGPGPEAVEDVWFQPVANATFDPSCLRLIGTEVRLKKIKSDPYQNQIYFSGIGSHNPPPNYSYDASDYMKYRFIGLRNCSTQLQPYQQTAVGSGAQYNADIGAVNLTVEVSDHGDKLVLDSSVSPTIASLGTTLTYTISYGNTASAPVGAPSIAPVIITTQLTSLAYVAGSLTCSANCLKLWSSDSGQTFVATEPAATAAVNALRWILLDPVPAGQSPAGTVGFQAKTTTNGELCNTTQSAINENIAIASDTACINASADVQVFVSGPSTVRPGGSFIYIVTYRNNGPSVAEDVVLTNILPPDVQLVRANLPPSSTSGPELSYRLGSLAAGQGGSITLQVAVSSALADGALLTNAARIVTTSTEPETANNSATSKTTVGSQAPKITATSRVRLVEDAPPLGPGAGDILEYSIIIKNTGTVAATRLVFISTPDPHTVLLIGSVSSALGTVLSGNAERDSQIRIEIERLAPNASETLEFRVRIRGSLAPGIERVRLQGFVTSNELPDQPTDDLSTIISDDPTDFYLGGGPLLKIRKSYSIFNDLDGNSLPSPGDILKYTVVIENLGNESATSVVFTDGLDPHLTLVVGSVSAAPGAVLSGNEGDERFVRVSIGTLAPKHTATVTFRAGINPDLPNHVAFVGGPALVSAANLPSQPSDDPSTLVEEDPTLTPVWAKPQLYIAQRAYLKIDTNGDGFPSPGDTLGYAVLVVNHSNAEATNVFFSNTPDLYTQLLVGSVRTSQGSVFTGNSITDSTVGVALGAVPRQAQAQISFDVILKESIPSAILNVTAQSLTNAANVGSFPSDDPATPALNDPTAMAIANRPLLRFTKSVYPASDDDRNGMVSAGELLEYVLTITNVGAQDAASLTVSDALNAGARILEGSTKAGVGLIGSGLQPNATELLVNMGTLGAHGGHARISFQVRLQNPLSERTITNQAFVWGQDLPEQPSDDPRTPALGDPTVLTAGEFFILCGDVEGDGDIDLEDARLAGQAALGALQLTERQRAAADVAPPFGVIDVRDANAIAEIAQGYRLRCPVSARTNSTALQTLANKIVPLKVERFTARRAGRAVRFAAQGQGIAEISVSVFSLAGQRVLHVDWQPGNELEWRALTSDGRPVANGIYLYMISVRGADGALARSRVQKLVILR